MAITKIIPIRTTIGKSVEYICNPSKTENCVFVHSEHCFPQTAAVEFDFYLRQLRAGGNTIGRHLIQSFTPDEVTPELAHEIGKKLADEILGGKYAYVMSTHVDRNHIHNHFVWCAVNIETHTKYRSNKRTYHEIQAASDRLCAENSLSIITEKSGQSGKGYYEYQAEKRGISWKEKLRQAIDTYIPQSADFEDFLNQMQAAGYEIKRGKYISFKAPEQQRFSRLKSIGEDYTEERIAERIQAEKAQISAPKHDTNSILQFIDIQSNEKIKNSHGLTQWAKNQNLKIAAKTLIILQENGLTDLNEFDRRYADCNDRFNKICDEMKQTESRIKNLEQLQIHIRRYCSTKEIYQDFRKAKNKDKFLRDNSDAESSVMLHEAAKKFFSEYAKQHGNPLPSSKAVAAELTKLKGLKQRQYKEYAAVKDEWQKLIRLYSNLKDMLGKDNPKIKSMEMTL